MSANGKNTQPGLTVATQTSDGKPATSVTKSTSSSVRPNITGKENKLPSSGASGTTKPAKDTTWFKRSCKDVVIRPKPGTDTSDNRDALLDQRGMHFQLNGDNSSAILINKDQLWGGSPQILRYWFLSGNNAGTDVQKNKVREAIHEWTWYANVEFQEAATAADSTIRILFDPNDGSWSSVGRQCEKIAITDATMNLAWLDKSSPSMTTNERAVILHEFGHVLGLLHEHQSPAHDGHAIERIDAAIDLYTKTQGLTVQQIYDQVINVYSMSDVSNFPQVDTNSIMHYPQPKEITGLPNDIPYNTSLTDLDKAYMILQYPRKEMHPKAKQNGWTFEKALDVMGAPGLVKTQVLRLLRSDRDGSTGEISPINTRQMIEDWTRSTHAKSGTISSPSTSVNPAQTVTNLS